MPRKCCDETHDLKLKQYRVLRISIEVRRRLFPISHPRTILTGVIEKNGARSESCKRITGTVPLRQENMGNGQRAESRGRHLLCSYCKVVCKFRALLMHSKIKWYSCVVNYVVYLSLFWNLASTIFCDVEQIAPVYERLPFQPLAPAIQEDSYRTLMYTRPLSFTTADSTSTLAASPLPIRFNEPFHQQGSAKAPDPLPA